MLEFLFGPKPPEWSKHSGHTARSLERLWLAAEQHVQSKNATCTRRDRYLDIVFHNGRQASMDMADLAFTARPGREQYWPGILKMQFRDALSSEAPPLAKPERPEPAQAPEGLASYRPIFKTKRGTFDAGTAFVIPTPERSYDVVVTCLHLFGPDGGLDHQVCADALPALVTNVKLRDPLSKAVVSNQGSVIAIATADASDPMRDLCAFHAFRPHTAQLLPLATRDVVRGDRVRLVATVKSGAPREQRLHAARVTDVEPGRGPLITFETRDLELAATSGAPVVDEEGAVAGVVVRCVSGNDGLVGAIVLPVGRLREMLLPELPELRLQRPA